MKEEKRLEVKEEFKKYEGIKGAHKIYKSLGDKPYEDLSGNKFHRLTAIRAIGREKVYGRVLWLCECECGESIILEATRLKRDAKSCGCMQKEKGKNLRDLTNQIFGKLKVVSRAEEDYVGEDGRHRPRWVCSCECGGTIILRSRQLLSGAVTCCDECNPKKRRKVMRHDLVGQTFNRLTVLSRAENSSDGHSRWLCKCSCGQLTTVLGKHLLSGAIKSCGCYQKDHTTALDIKGQKFGRWTAIEKVKKDKRNNWIWRCVCECGTERLLTVHTLISGGSKSCGCLKSELTHKRQFKSLIGKRFGKLVVQEQVADHIYPDGSHRAKYRCLCDCGGITEVTSISLTSGSVRSCGCTLSFGEEKVARILNENVVTYKKQKSYKDLLSDKGCRLRFDFYIPEGNYLIEYDGVYHYKASGRSWSTQEYTARVQHHDRLKNEYCKEHGIPLIRIPYTQYNNLCIEDLILETTKFRVI